MENTIRHQFYLEVGKSIRTARMRSNYSQLDLAKKLNMSRVSVVNIEKGRQSAPLYLIWVIASVLDTSINELIPDTNFEFNQLNIFEQIISSSTKERNFGDDASQKLNSFISEM